MAGLSGVRRSLQARSAVEMSRLGAAFSVCDSIVTKLVLHGNMAGGNHACVPRRVMVGSRPGAAGGIRQLYSSRSLLTTSRSARRLATAAFLPPPKGLQKRNQLGMFRIIPQALSETQSSCAHRMRSVARQPLAQLSSP